MNNEATDEGLKRFRAMLRYYTQRIIAAKCNAVKMQQAIVDLIAFVEDHYQQEIAARVRMAEQALRLKQEQLFEGGQ